MHRSHSLAERPPIVGSIEHSQRHPEVTRYGDELFVIYLAVNSRTVIPQGPTLVPVACELVLARGSEGQEQRRAHPALLTHARRVASPASAWAGLSVSRPS